MSRTRSSRAGIAQVVSEVLEPRRLFSVYTVTNADSYGVGSLAAELIAANNHTNVGGLDVIKFNIPANKLKPIQNNFSITDPVRIDGYSQPGASANTAAVGNNAKLLISIVPVTGTSGNQDGLSVNLADGTVLRGLNISGYSENIYVNDSQGVTVDGCFLGTNLAGTAATRTSAYPNGSADVVAAASDDLTVTNSVLSGNQSGVEVIVSDNALISDNLIGTNAAGTKAIPNALYGVYSFASSGPNIIFNTISGNVLYGVNINGADGAAENLNILKNNIGVGANGATKLGNGRGTLGGGIIVQNGQETGTISTNIIANNTGGVQIKDDNTVHIGISQNSIYANQGIGIDLNNEPGTESGVTANDNGDFDLGGNDLQNKPVLTSSAVNGNGKLTVSGNINSAANHQYHIEVFATISNSPTTQGQTYLLSGEVKAGGNGRGNFTLSGALPAAIANAGSVYLTSTATDESFLSFTLGDTSEFSTSIKMRGGAMIATDATTTAAVGKIGRSDTGLSDGGISSSTSGLSSFAIADPHQRIWDKTGLDPGDDSAPVDLV